MNANYYLDIRVLESSGDADLKLPHIRNQIYAVVHGAFRSLDAPYALALHASGKLQNLLKQQAEKYKQPIKFDFDILRIFAETQEQLQQLQEAIKGHWRIRDYTVLMPPQAVISADIIGWKSYRRFRIPTESAERSKLSQKNPPLRGRRLKYAKDKNKPFFLVNSKSTGQKFTVIMDIHDCDNAGTGLPDSYGLARENNPFALPVLKDST